MQCSLEIFLYCESAKVKWGLFSEKRNVRCLQFPNVSCNFPNARGSGHAWYLMNFEALVSKKSCPWTQLSENFVPLHNNVSINLLHGVTWKKTYRLELLDLCRHQTDTCRWDWRFHQVLLVRCSVVLFRVVTNTSLRRTWYISNPQPSHVKQATSISGFTSPTLVQIPCEPISIDFVQDARRDSNKCPPWKLPSVQYQQREYL